jgi:DNA-formamidopyrimidine glycosylase
MPEGPEVTVIRQGLHKILQNQYIHQFDYDFKTSRYHKKKPIGYNEFSSTLPSKILEVNSKGKFIYFKFDNGWYLYNTLGMSGGWYMHLKSHPHLVVHYIKNKVVKNEDELEKIWFIDPRHFGTFKFVKGETELNKKLKTIGADLLNDNITDTEFITKYRKCNHKKIDVVLNDQKVFSGIGNYLKAEILYTAAISPHTLIGNIPDWKLKELLNAIKDRITASYKMGGASVQNYSDLKDNEGKFQQYFQVYKKKIDSHGNKVISERVSKPNDPKSQKTYWAPDVQKDNFD